MCRDGRPRDPNLRRWFGHDGFTLIETLVAFAVLAMFMLMVQGLVVGSVIGSDRAKDKLGADAVARTLMTGPMAIGTASSQSGRMNGFDWRIRFAPLPAQLPPIRSDGKPAEWLPLRMTVEVRSPGRTEHDVRVETVRLLKVDAP